MRVGAAISVLATWIAAAGVLAQEPVIQPPDQSLLWQVVRDTVPGLPPADLSGLGVSDAVLSVTGDAGTAPLPGPGDDSTQVQLGPDEALAVEMPGAAAVREAVGPQGVSGERLVLPVRYVVRERESENLLYLRPVVETLGSGLQLGGDGREGFAGRLRVGLEDSVSPGVSRRLSRAVRFQMGGGIDEADPAVLTVDHTNVPFQDVSVFVRRSDLPDSVRIDVRSSLGTRPVEFAVDVIRPRIELTGPSELLGFGLETGTYTVRIPATGDGREWDVVVSGSSGRPRPPTLSVPEGEVRTFELRSAGRGTAILEAAAPPAETARLEVRYTTPLAFGLFAVLGGALGGVIRGVRRHDERHESPGIVAYALTGIVVGLVVAVAYTVGINLVGLRFAAESGEALVFTLAALGGAVGPSLLNAGGKIGGLIQKRRG